MRGAAKREEKSIGRTDLEKRGGFLFLINPLAGATHRGRRGKRGEDMAQQVLSERLPGNEKGRECAK